MSNKRLEMLLLNRGGNYKTKIFWIVTISPYSEGTLAQ